MSSKSVVAKKTTKKVTAPKPAKVAKPKAGKGVAGEVNMKAELRFVSFSVRAVIPTQSFGNIQPEITVEAPTYEEARDFALPHIEALYAHYADTKPAFLGKVTETVKVISGTAQVAPEATEVAPKAPQTAPVAPQAQDTPAPVATASSAPEAPEKPKSEAVMKAEKAIGLAMTAEAAVLIQDQIEKSVKIAPEDKPALIKLVLQRRNDLKDK